MFLASISARTSDLDLSPSKIIRKERDVRSASLSDEWLSAADDLLQVSIVPPALLGSVAVDFRVLWIWSVRMVNLFVEGDLNSEKSLSSGSGEGESH